MLNYVVLAIPVFLALIGVEWLVARFQRRALYRLADSVADLSCGTLEQLVDVFVKTALFTGYALLYERARLFEIPLSSPVAWLACFLGVDFCYYWFHRLSHEVGAFWAAHVVHHQSEEYNLTVALRQSVFQGWFSWVFYLPLAWLGFPPAMFLTLSAANTVYQFWIHTRAIGRLPWLDGWLNTPSNHRVHHARNPQYIDRNHGGTLIVWDRWFGTYEPEGQEPVYGITKPLASWNPLWANLHYWVELFSKARRATRWHERLGFFLLPPGWRPASWGGPEPAPPVDAASLRKFDPPAPRALAPYVVVHFATVIAATVWLLWRQHSLDRGRLAGGTLLVAWGLLTLTGLLEGRRWAVSGECLRLAILAVAAAWLASGAGLGTAPAALLALLPPLSGACLWAGLRGPVPDSPRV